jgi:hypothetical protein
MDIFAPHTMTRSLVESKTPRMFLRDTFFGVIETHPTTAVSIYIIEGKRKVAPYVNPMSEGVIMEKDGQRAETYTPPLLKPKDYTTADRALKLVSQNDTIFNSESPQVRAAKQLREDMLSIDHAIDRAEEIQAAQALFEGKIIVKGKGVNHAIDFGLTAAQKPVLTSTAKWTDAASSPLSDLQTWQIQSTKASGKVPTDVIFGADVLSAFLDHADVKEAFDSRNIHTGEMSFEDGESGAMKIGTIARLGLTIWSYSEWYLDEVSQLEIPMVPANKLVMLSRRADFRRHYGVIPEVIPVQAQRYVKTKEIFDPAGREILIQSAPLCVPHEKNTLVIAQAV